jgi:ABC-type glycerol-3-phosphate transport system substrate-binding protein
VAVVLITITGVLFVRTRHSGPTYPKQWDSRVTEIVAFDEKERGLTYKHPVEIEFLSEDDFKAEVTSSAADLSDEERRKIDNETASFRALGLVDGGVDLFKEQNNLSGGATLAYIYGLFGESFAKDLYGGQQVAFNADYQQLANSVGQGAYPIGMSLVQTTTEPLRKAGIPLERVFPEDGPGTTLGGFSVVVKVKNSPHPNAGAVFLNWFLSKDAQEMYEGAMMETSLRTDVSHKVPEYVIPKPGVRYVDGYDPDFHFGTRVPAEAKVKEWFPR